MNEQQQPPAETEKPLIPEVMDMLPGCDVTKPPTANLVTYIAAQLLKGVSSGKVTHQAAMGGAKLVDAIARAHSNKISLLKYTSKPAPKSLLKELSLDV